MGPPLNDGINEKGISMVAGPPTPPGYIPSITERMFPRANWRSFTAALSAFQILLFLITLIVGAAKYDGAFVKNNKMAGPSAITLRAMGGKFTDDIRNQYELHRLLTPVFLHAGILHLLSNLFFQLRFGFICEVRWGIAKFALLYFVCGIGANFWSAVLSPFAVSVGASGALFGILGCDIAYLIYNWQEIPHRGAEACTLAFVVLLNLLFGLSSEIDNWAHLGGLITGLLIAVAVTTPLVEKPNEKFLRGASAVATGGMFLLFILLLWVGNPLQQ
jgi:membrane associated rhomboid family serine protease